MWRREGNIKTEEFKQLDPTVPPSALSLGWGRLGPPHTLLSPLRGPAGLAV